MEQETLERDLALQRASQNALVEVKKHLKRLTVLDYAATPPARLARQVDLIRKWLDVFQEDPQLLDPVLNQLLPPVLSSYLDLIQSSSFQESDGRSSQFAAGLSRIICTFCKVRGRKVVSRFLSNEPKYIHPVFSALQRLEGSHDSSDGESAVENGKNDWQQHFVVLLWLSHLVLTPFDLGTFSGLLDCGTEVSGLKLPSKLPEIAADAVKASISSMDSATSRQVVASSLLTRLVLRPDMQKIGLLDLSIPWAVTTLESLVDASTIHKAVGILMFLNGIVASGSLHDIHHHLPLIYDSVGKLFNAESDTWQALRTSATAKKFAVKIQRNIVVQLLQGRESKDSDALRVSQKLLEDQGVLEDVIDYLLRSLADRDTQVRMVASKSLAFIALKLDADMAQEVVDAVIGSMNEDVLDAPHGKSLEAVNPIRWHGLTLTLSNMLFRRTPSTSQISEILDALYLALTFEQKSSSGSSIGGNVRDAANYGLWSLARRYSTKELHSGRQMAGSGKAPSISIIQKTANHLVGAACLDPVGNVRRGSSAALQELVGRHPDTIANGISLIQTVDYLAVGLRSRAMTTIATQAANLNQAYRDHLVQELLGWRGLSIPDQAARSCAAKALGSILGHLNSVTVQTHLLRLSNELKLVDCGSSENIEGLLLAEAEIVSHCARSMGNPDSPQAQRSDRNVLDSMLGWRWLTSQLESLKSILHLTGRRSNLVANGILCLVNALSVFLHTRSCDAKASAKGTEHDESTLPEVALSAIVQALKALDEDSLALGALFEHFDTTVSPHQRGALVLRLISALSSSARVSSQPGVARALGYLWVQNGDGTETSKQLRDQILNALVRIASASEAIEVRAIAIRSLGTISTNRMAATASDPYGQSADHLIAQCCLSAMDDYTINERGDVGSIIRSQALQCIFNANKQSKAQGLRTQCYLSAIRLSLEKLDRVRLDAVIAIANDTSERLPWQPFVCGRAGMNLTEVSSYEHFFSVTRFLASKRSASLSGELVDQICIAIIEGIASSAGSGTSTVLPVARAALTDVLDALPTFPEDATAGNCSLAHFISLFTAFLAANQANDRVLIPALDLLAFLLDAHLPQRLAARSFKFRALLSAVQKAHFRSASVPKLLAAISAYRGLAQIAPLRRDVLAKMLGMLAHPFPTVRRAVAEALWVATEREALLGRDWGAPVEGNKALVAGLKSELAAGTFDVA